MNVYRFKSASADEKIVYGSERPGYPGEPVGREQIMEWIRFMKDEGIKRVCCLLTREQLNYFEEDLMSIYREKFGGDNLCWAPVEDFHLCDLRTLTEEIIPFLATSSDRGEPVVIHCAGGMGRTGHVLAAWLVYGRGYNVEQALSEVKARDRNPYEAVEKGTATMEQLYELLEACRRDGRKNTAGTSGVSK